MTERIHITNVGAPDPELRNSPILDESDYDEQLGMDADSLDTARCQFNGADFANGSMICSGDELLRCSHGTWLRCGSCDEDNP